MCSCLGSSGTRSPNRQQRRLRSCGAGLKALRSSPSLHANELWHAPPILTIRQLARCTYRDLLGVACVQSQGEQTGPHRKPFAARPAKVSLGPRNTGYGTILLAGASLQHGERSGQRGTQMLRPFNSSTLPGAHCAADSHRRSHHGMRFKPRSSTPSDGAPDGSPQAQDIPSSGQPSDPAQPAVQSVSDRTSPVASTQTQGPGSRRPPRQRQPRRRFRDTLLLTLSAPRSLIPPSSRTQRSNRLT